MQYRPVDFKTGELSEPHWAILLQIGTDEPFIVSASPVSETEKLMPKIIGDRSNDVGGEQAATSLYLNLFSSLDRKLAGLTSVYIIPDGILNLVPINLLKLPDRRYWEERQEVRLLQTGSDLLRPTAERPARGLLALGGIDFGAATRVTEAQSREPPERDMVIVASVENAALGSDSAPAWQETRDLTRETFLEGWRALPASEEEAARVAAAYRVYRRDEPAETWTGASASEERLKALGQPPRVLHLATHGFYLSGEDGNEKVARPMVLSGITLAGANRALKGEGEDGILYGIEAQGLNLEGTELVVLSACDTAHGSIDYGEGVYGLVRALRIAGARQVLVTLWPVNDGQARDFMTAFYRTWLEQERSDPAAALRQTRLSYIAHSDVGLRDPRVWAPYVLIGQ